MNASGCCRILDAHNNILGEERHRDRQRDKRMARIESLVLAKLFWLAT
jgi:hypothetical protein